MGIRKKILRTTALAAIAVLTLASCSLLNIAKSEHERIKMFQDSLNGSATAADLNTNMATDVMSTVPDQTAWNNLFDPAAYAPYTIATVNTPTPDTTSYPPATTTETEQTTINSGAHGTIQFWFVVENGNYLIRALTYTPPASSSTTFQNIE